MAANTMIYVVYPYAAGRFNAVKVSAKVGTIDIHKALARFENDEERSKRRWTTPIEAGCFNIAKITDAHSRADAIQQAREQGLKYEPKPVVLNRYKSEISAARAAFDNIGRQNGAAPRPSTRQADVNSAFDGIFGDFMKDIKKGPKY